MTDIKPRRDFDWFLERVVAQEPYGCWTWIGSRTVAGYGQMGKRGRSLYAHRYACEEAFGPIPDGLVVDHLCSNPSCVNPAHLEPVTQGENMRRGRAHTALRARAAALTSCKRGHPLHGENLRIDGRGHRSCRACMALLSQGWRAANRNRVNELQRVRRRLAALDHH